MKEVKRKYEDTEDWTVMWCETEEESNECIKDPSIIWPIITRTVRRIIKEGRQSLPALEVRCAELIGSIWVTVRREECLSTLNKQMKWRLQREEYEECAEIRDLINELLISDREVASSVKKSADIEVR